MKKELDEKLCEDFPLLYRDRNAGIHRTCMSWGFECEDGWFQLIYDLSAKLEPMIQQFIIDNPGEDAVPCASQVKEKYGTLRFYTTLITDEMSDAIDRAEKKSGTICAVCGEPGKVRNTTGWMRTLCKTHHGEGK